MTTLLNQSAVANELLERLSQATGGRATVATVFGDPVDREGITVIPVATNAFRVRRRRRRGHEGRRRRVGRWRRRWARS